MTEIDFREAIRSALDEELARDERVILMGEDIGVFGGAFKVTDGLLEEFGETRVRDTPISGTAPSPSRISACSGSAASRP